MTRLANHEVQQLLALRLAVERARRDARRAGRYQRGSAIVALDSNVERACALVAVARGLSVPSNGKLDDLISQVKQSLGPDWRPTVLPDIKQLRRARTRLSMRVWSLTATKSLYGPPPWRLSWRR